MDMFSKGQPGAVKREKVGRPSKNTPEKRSAYDQGRRRAKADASRAAEARANSSDEPETRFSKGVLRRRVGPK